MSSTELERIESSAIAETFATFARLAGQIAKTEFVPRGLRGRPEAVLAAMLYGRELGLQPMTALRLIQIVEGNVGLSAEGMRAVVRSHGHRIWVSERTDTSVTVCGQRGGDDAGAVEEVTWTMDDAATAGLTSKDVWKKYPRAMLLARATSELCRSVFPDVIGGLSYTPEELTGIDTTSLDITEPDKVPVAATTSLTAGRAKHALLEEVRRQGWPAGKAEAEAGRLWGDLGSDPVAPETLEDLMAQVESYRDSEHPAAPLDPTRPFTDDPEAG
jgi:hypothetical protein